MQQLVAKAAKIGCVLTCLPAYLLTCLPADLVDDS